MISTELCWLFQSKLGHINERVVWLIAFPYEMFQKSQLICPALMMNSTRQQVCLVNAAVISTELFGTINKNELSLTMCHQLHYTLHFRIFTTFTGGINSASCSYTSFLNFLQHHCILIPPSWTKCRGFGKFLYEAVT